MTTREQIITIGEVHKSMVLDDPLYKKGFDAGAASRDAEVESLRQQLDHIKQVEFPRKVEAVVAGWKTKLAAQKEHSKEQFEKLLRWVDDYCEVSDTDFEQIEPVVQSVLGEVLEETPVADLRQQLADSQKQVTLLRDAINKFLLDNDPEGFGCACSPNFVCGPCSEARRQRPLYESVAATEPEEQLK